MAQNEVLSGNLEGGVTLKQRKADYDEARRLSGSDSCWSDSDGGSDNETAPELDIGPSTLEGAGVAVAQEGDLEEEGLGSLQHQGKETAMPRKRVQREEQAGGTKRRGGLRGAGQAGGKKRRPRQGRATQGQTVGKCYLEGFCTSPGGIKPVACKYAVGAVESQVWVQGAAGTEVRLGVKPTGTKGSVIGSMLSGKLQRLVGGNNRWCDRPRGKGKEGWMVQSHRWEASGGEAALAVGGATRRREVVGWYLPVKVMSEKALTRASGRVTVQTRRVAVGRSAGVYAQAVRVKSRKEWCIQTMNEKVLVGVTGRLVHVDGQEEVLVVGDEMREEWTWQTVEGTAWRKGAKDEWAVKERAVLRGIQLKSVNRDRVYDRG